MKCWWIARQARPPLSTITGRPISFLIATVGIWMAVILSIPGTIPRGLTMEAATEEATGILGRSNTKWILEMYLLLSPKLVCLFCMIIPAAAVIPARGMVII